LVALGIIEALEAEKGIDVLELEHNSTAYLHILIEAMRLAFADSKLLPPLTISNSLQTARYYVTDPAFENVPVDELLSKVCIPRPR
jgi:gamma-glutamyltranspeptidase/glutathione hydrolase